MKNTRHYPLTTAQIETLRLLYKFRFLTPSLLAQYRNLKSDRSARLNLEVMVNRQYLHKRYDKSYRLAGKGAVYSLAAKGIQYLKDNYELNPIVLHGLYSNPRISESFVEAQLELVKVFLTLRKQYPEKFDQFMRVELVDQDYFPEPRPDMYLRRKKLVNGKAREYFLYVINDVQLFIIKKRLRPMFEHYENEGWDGDYPTILLVLSTPSIETRVRDYLDSLDLDDELKILLSNKIAMQDSAIVDIWTESKTGAYQSLLYQY